MNFFSDNQIDQIREGALSILENIGVRVHRSDLVNRLSRIGFSTCDDYVLIDRTRALKQIELYTASNSIPERIRPFNTYTSAYSHMYEKIDGSGFEPISDESNAAMGKLVNHASKLWPGLSPTCPGHPVDVHPEMQFFRQVINSFIWCENFYSMEPVSLKIANYQFEACEVMGRPIKGLPIYVASPLNIAGESLDIAIAYSKKLTSAWVGSMPSLGANTPLNLIAAYAQTIAETLGGAVIFEELTGVPTSFGTNLFTFDFHAMSMPFGTPEKLILEWMNAEVGAKLGGGKSDIVYSTDIHTNAVHSGMQACVEKASLAMAGAMRGAQSFGCSGTLGMDELFSPVQLLIDLEMLTHIEHIIDSLPIDEYTDNLIDEVREGLKKGYMYTDRTLDNYKQYQWYPRFFNRKTFGNFLNAKFPFEIDSIRELLHELMSKEPSWKLDEDRVLELEYIYSAALKSLN